MLDALVDSILKALLRGSALLNYAGYALRRIPFVASCLAATPAPVEERDQ
jgi:hypothetical protein